MLENLTIKRKNFKKPFTEHIKKMNTKPVKVEVLPYPWWLFTWKVSFFLTFLLILLSSIGYIDADPNNWSKGFVVAADVKEALIN